MVMVSMPEEEDGTARKDGLNEHAGRDDAAVLWDMIRQELKPGLPNATYETWLKPTKGIKFDYPMLVVESPTAFSLGWLERRLRTQIDKAARQVAGEKLKVRFKISEVPPYIQQPHKPDPDLDEQLAREIRSNLVISEVIGRHVQLRRFGTIYKGECPFHQGNEPTLIISYDDRRWHCFGACDTGGDVISFVMRADDLDYTEALHQIAARTGISARATSKRPDRRSRDGFRSLARYGTRWNLGEMTCRGIDRLPVAGNLAYPLQMGLKKVQPGLVTSVYPNFQPHIEIEYPSGETDIVDSEDFRDAGSVIWTDTGKAILKDLESGEHCSYEVEIKGVTTRGFCLLKAPGQREYTWFPPRRPDEAGGGNRQVLLDGGARDRAFAMESFFVDLDVLPEIEDISMVVVKMQTPERSPRRHRDHLGASH